MTARTEKSAWVLLRETAGTPREMADKMRRLASVLIAYTRSDALDTRLRYLQELGYVDTPPTRLQLIVGSIDMLRFWIVPAAADYYEDKGIDFRFHQVLRFLDEPAGLADPTGFLTTRDGIIGHVMQVVHANPAYDLQLLESYPDGLEQLETQVLQMIEGTHPKHRSISAIVEEPDYHERLLGYVREFRASRDAKAPVRINVQDGPFAEIEKIFGTLPGAMRYFSNLPTTPWGAARHLLTATGPT